MYLIPLPLERSKFHSSISFAAGPAAQINTGLEENDESYVLENFRIRKKGRSAISKKALDLCFESFNFVSSNYLQRLDGAGTL